MNEEFGRDISVQIILLICSFINMLNSALSCLILENFQDDTEKKPKFQGVEEKNSDYLFVR